MFRNSPAVIRAFLVLGLLLSPGTRLPRVLAQDAGVPNISGTWELVEDNRDKKSRGNPKFPKLTLIITQQGAELKITRKRIRIARNRKINGTEDVREFAYHTDGRVDTNLGRFQLWYTAPKLDSVSRLAKNGILTEFKRQAYTDSYSGTNTAAREEWVLDETGTRLVLKTWAINLHFNSITDNGRESFSPSPSTDWERQRFVFRKIS